MTCIRCGLIQSNTGYRALFEASTIRAEITDEALCVQAASVPHELFPEDKLREAARQTTHLDRNTLLKGSPIRKGFVFCQEDISELQDALDDLRLVQDELLGTGDLLKAENAQKARKLKLEEQTKLYDLVEQESAPQFARLESLLSQLSGVQSQEGAKPLLGRIAVIMTYIKRRSNLHFFFQRACPADESPDACGRGDASRQRYSDARGAASRAEKSPGGRHKRCLHARRLSLSRRERPALFGA